MKIDQLISHLHLNNPEFYFQFQSHPNYPSALAFSDTLNFLGIKNDAYNLEKEYWEELPGEFITIYRNNFAFIKKGKNGITVFSDKEEKISQGELLENSQNFILLFEKTKENSEKSIFSFSYFIYLLFGITFLYSVFLQNWQALAYNLLSMLGFYISLEIFSKKFGKESVVLDNFCGSGNKNSAPENCTKIIDSDKINILELKLSDFSLIYFSAILILGLFLPITAGVLKIVSACSVIAIVYSLFIQIFKEKALCRICLLVIAILGGQIAISSLFFSTIFSVQTIILSAVAFLVLFFGLVFINDVTKQKEKYRKSDIKNLRFKRNYDLFKRELSEGNKIDFRNTNMFLLGNLDAKLHISLVSNPYCGFCKDAHKILEKLLEKYPEDISVQIRFNYNKENTEYTELLSYFKNIYETKTVDEFLNTVKYWFETRNGEKIKEKFPSVSESQDLDSLIKISEENRNYNLNFTPILLLNGYQFPDKYDREDIFYFIEDILGDEEFC